MYKFQQKEATILIGSAWDGVLGYTEALWNLEVWIDMPISYFQRQIS